ncbi:nucleoside triphosphate hydrolase [Pseudaminobacter arsenicus]|uniref:Nucleoside triphosphate hydrolase n=1 Tax=Borborobacter arsenicus TaxID=1851146 RepID=A0A432V3E5_9HYPH|nr:nucleoside triphosphate hydrolase [Pseudaminobacter arsenicus]RUM96562.1 nucleoside triphosphate hydrolase [Pseudaminobacter arsenicus]
MSEIATIAASIFRHAARMPRFVVAIAGAPAAGKSTLAEKLHDLLPEGSAVVVQMDGFHFDDAILHQRGLRSRKGAPETFDYAGFAALLRRIRAAEPDIAIPVFDRDMELSRAGARIIGADIKFVLVEGNYLLLDEAPWNDLAPLFDFSIFLDVPRAELERRLMMRWREQGRPDEEARAWVASNDLPNAERILARLRRADLVLSEPSAGTGEGYKPASA